MRTYHPLLRIVQPRAPDDDWKFSMSYSNAIIPKPNESQLKAIQHVCTRDVTDSMPLHPICLLQGPPGTGKTKTILGILAVLLAGAVKLVPR